VKVWVSVDMEGIAGVAHPRPTERGDQGYPAAAALMVAAVVPLAKRAGDRTVRIETDDPVLACRALLAARRLASLAA
jgi:D-aminopeptidase